jgi:hypothetical protein
MYKNGKMEPVETISGMGREGIKANDILTMVYSEELL